MGKYKLGIAQSCFGVVALCFLFSGDVCYAQTQAAYYAPTQTPAEQQRFNLNIPREIPGAEVPHLEFSQDPAIRQRQIEQ